MTDALWQTLCQLVQGVLLGNCLIAGVVYGSATAFSPWIDSLDGAASQWRY
ncbi:MAG: hypothetical protein AAFR99_09100 [Cyanobacteria bacterium J06629_9]